MTGARQARMTVPVSPPGVIDRAHLMPRLASRPVVVLSGMAGYGKSTLLAAAARRQQEDGAAIWLTVESSDKDPARLVADLMTAADIAGLDALGDPLERLRAAALRAQPLALVDSLLEALYDSAVPLTLALDDVQQLAGAEGATEIVDHVLRWAPANVRIAMAARVVPPLRLQRLRLEDRLAYLAHGDLAFTAEETSAAVDAAGLDLDPLTIESIHDATSGWPAGVRMALLAARHHGTSFAVPLELRRDRALADYLATEVLAALDDDVRAFVLESSLDEEVCASLLNSIRGTTNAESLLEECVAAGLFLTRGGPSATHQWYHWHPLFAAHTSRRLATDQPERAARLHLEAAQWWTTVDVPTAITHALAAGDGDTASKIFADGWLDLVLQGRVDAVLTAVGQLPVVSSHASHVHLARALLLLQDGRLDDAHLQLDAARAESVRLPDDDQDRFAERSAVVELFLTGQEKGLAAAVTAGSTLLEQFREEQHSLDAAVRGSVQAFVGMSQSRLEHRTDLALDWLRSSAAIAHDAGFVALELTALAESCIPAIVGGRLTERHDLAVDVLTRADERGWVGLVTLAPAVAYLGWLDFWRGDLSHARTQLEKSLSMMVPFDQELRGLALNFLAQTCLSLHDLRAARVAEAQIRALVEAGDMPDWWPSMLSGLEGLLLLAEGRTRAAVALAATPPAGPDYRLAPSHRALVLLRAGRPADALAALEASTVGAGLVHVECLSHCIEAEALAALGRDAHPALELALAAAEPDGLYGPFLAAGPVMSDLLKAHLRHGTSHPTTVTHVLGRITEGQNQNVTGWGEKLTERESVILQYLATNLTNAEIAEAEFISLHTAKTHIAHIYRKLGVSNRRSAIRRAAELELY